MYNKYLGYIANIICLNYQHIPCTGLIRGHLGAVIFLYHYAKYSGIIEYEKKADGLLDYVLTNIAPNANKAFSYGIYGIGWCLKYLAQKGFIEIDQETLSDYDLVASYGWSRFETEEDLLSEIPLFSKGIYCSDAVDETIIRNTSEVLKETIDKYTINKLSYLNSCLYFLAKCKDGNRIGKEQEEILSRIMAIVNECLSTPDYSAQDLFILKMLAQKMDMDINIPEFNVEYLRDIFLNWQTIVYEDVIHIRNIICLSDMGKYIEDNIETTFDNNLSLTGLSALGINVIRCLENDNITN